MNKRIRILFTISNFNTAGSGKVVYDLIHGLDKTKFDIEIACGDNKGSFFKTIESLEVPIHIFETKTSYKPYLSLFSRVWSISKFYKKQKYDIIHSWQWSSDWTEALAARFAGKKWIYTKKAMGFGNKHWKIKSYLAHFIITINDEMIDYFPKKMAQRLIPLGIDTHYYSPEHFSVEAKVKMDRFNIITVANLVRVKGLEVLIKAIYSLNDKTIHLSVLGDNNNKYGKEMEELCHSLDMQDQIVFYGKQPDVRPYLAQADLYVIPTLNEGRKEGMPMALVEAMSMGVPLLGADISGINYVLKDFKELLFLGGNVEALGRKIQSMQHMSMVEREVVGHSLRQYCKNHFSMTAFIQNHESLYTKLIG